MGRSFFAAQTRVVEIDEENRVTIKKLPFGDSQAVLSQSMVVGVAAVTEAQFDYGRNRVAVLTKSIVSWEGPGFEGRPVTPENIAALPNDVAQKVLEAADELNEVLSEGEKK